MKQARLPQKHGTCVPMVVMLVLMLLGIESACGLMTISRSLGTNETAIAINTLKEKVEEKCFLSQKEHRKLQYSRRSFLNKTLMGDICTDTFYWCLVVGQGKYFSIMNLQWWDSMCSSKQRGGRASPLHLGGVSPSLSYITPMERTRPSAREGPSTDIMQNDQSDNREYTRTPRKAIRGNLERIKQETKISRLIRKADCRPYKTLVPVPSDPRYHTEPCMVEVKRCTGCTSSEVMECVPSVRKLRTFPVYQFNNSVSRSHTNIRRTPSTPVDMTKFIRKVQVEEHKKCAPQCKIRKSDCHPNQIYSETQCQCICSYTLMCPPSQVFSTDTCGCVCKRLKNCSTGTTFSHQSCKCELDDPYTNYVLL